MAEKLVKPRTAEEFQAMLHHIYGEANKRFGDSDLILRLLEEIAAVMEIARKDERELFPAQLARTCSWWFALTSRLKLDVQEMLWNKYPGVCPYCLKPENCSCGVEHPNIPKEQKEMALRRLRHEREAEPRTFAGHQALHRKLYFLQNRRILPINTAAHLAEEAGEISKEFRHRNFEALQDEMADAASWMFALANRCEFDLAEAIWSQYPYECERCRKMVCDCKH